MTSLSLSAAMAPPSPAKSGDQTLARARMLDARVNLRSSFEHATKARATKARDGVTAAKAQTSVIVAAVKTLKNGAMPGLDVKLSGYTGAPETFRNARGTLTATGGASETVVRNFMRQRGAIFGFSSADVDDLVVLGDSAGGSKGVRMLRMEQRVNGRPVFQSETRFILDRSGRLVSGNGRLVPHARSFASHITSGDFMPAANAMSKLLAFEGKTVDAASFTAQTVEGRLELTTADDSYISGPVYAREVLFPLAPGLIVPAWSLHVSTSSDADWYAIVDAETGDLLWRKNVRNYVSTHDARFRVYVQADGKTPADNPAPQSPNNVVPGSGTQFPGIAPTIVSMHAAYDPVASPDGWINDCPAGICTANESQTLGNNTLTCLDRSGANNVCDTAASSVIDGNGRPTGNPDANARNRDFLGTAPRDFQTNYLPPPQGGNPEAGQTASGNGNNGTLAVDQFRRGVVTHLFYLTNWYHDRLFALGFDEASANFQQTNFSGMGLGGDRVMGDAQDATSVNNANFATFPDGTPGRMQMYVFNGPTIDRDGSLDAEIVIHELTHGTSNRLVGNAAGLNWDVAAGMGEGWSDFYALSLLNNTNADAPTGQYGAGAYATYKLGGLLDNYLYAIRRMPYSTINTVNPLTWADVDDTTNNLGGGIAPSPLNIFFNPAGGMEVHNSGELWANTLWEVRSRIIADPAGANGDVPTGNTTSLQLVTNGLKMTPIDPTFVDARDAILNADCATNTCANEDSIWGGFADRGFGYGARAPYYMIFAYAFSGHMAFHESTALPYLDVVDPLTDVTIDDSASNNNGDIDPGEAVRITVSLTNPWRSATKNVTAGAVATLSTTTPGVTIYDATSTYPAIAAQGSASGDSFMFTVDPSVTAGTAIAFSMSITSSLGTTSTSFTVRVGTRNGTDPAVTYTNDPSPNVAIPDGNQLGVTNSLVIADDYEVADVDFLLDSLTHPYDGDVNVMLKSPLGVGCDLIGMVGLLLSPDDFGSAGANYTDMRIDDDPPTVGDMFAAPDTAAPYTGSWLPIYNTPTMAAFGIGPPDPTGTLSRHDGTSSKGTWTVLATDHATPDGGTLDEWSLIVTPVHFDVTAFAPAVLDVATKTVTGTFEVGGTVTYTITLTNNGTANQADNAGDEFVDILPASLTLVSANATSGTPVANVGTNTVTWNGSLAPLGGSVTITITATVDAGTQGTTISNQGTANYDADNNGTNEASVLTDDPSVGGTTDPTSFLVADTLVTGTKVVSGTLAAGSTVTYTVTLTNSGSAAQADNPGDEFSDVLPASLTLINANATSGTAVPNVGTNTVTWNGGIAASGSVTITITALVEAVPIGTTITNQGTINYDNDVDGTNESSTTTDDPSVAGTNDPTSFVTTGAGVTGTKTASGSNSVGGTVTYTVTLTNSGTSATSDNPGDEFTDVLPAGLTLVSANASSGTAVANVGTNTVTWNGSYPASGSVTITITATINSGTQGTTITNQGSFTYDADLNGTNESNGVTDDPSVAGSGNGTAIAVGVAIDQLTKTVSGTFATGGTITYTLTITNTGDTASPDNAGNELTDVLPSQLTLVSATASSGTAVATVATNTVTWNGAVPAGGSVTITINATIEPGNEGAVISNQATLLYDADGNGTNETTVLSDDPGTAAPSDPTVFQVGLSAIPTVSEWGLMLLAAGLAMLAAWKISRT